MSNVKEMAASEEKERLEISGGIPLEGSVNISGAKNAVLKLMPASLLANNQCIIRNVPRIRDVEMMIGVIQGKTMAEKFPP